MTAHNILAESADFVLSLAKKQGVDADVIASQSEGLSLKSDQGSLSEYKVTASRVIGIRVAKDQKVAISYSESFEPESLELMVREAITNARYSKIDKHQAIRAENQCLSTPESEIFKQETASIDDKIALALSLEQSVIDKPLAKSAPYNSYSDSSSSIVLANTLGSYCSHRERRFTCYTSALIDHNDKQSMYLGASVGRSFGDLNASWCVNHAYDTAQALLEGGPVKTGQYAVIFDQDSLNELMGAFGSCFSGESAKRGTNPWKDKTGTLVASPLLSFSDIAYVEDGMAVKSFDGEGFPTGDTSLIEEGKLIGFLHNSATADYFGVTHTANAGRSAKGALSISSRHDIIAAGKSSSAEVTSGEYLEIIDLQGVHSGADPISGEFSFGAAGFLCRDGKRIRPVRGITVAGNYYRMLQEVDAVSDTLIPDYSRTFFAPTIRFARLSVAGE